MEKKNPQKMMNNTPGNEASLTSTNDDRYSRRQLEEPGNNDVHERRKGEKSLSCSRISFVTQHLNIPEEKLNI